MNGSTSGTLQGRFLLGPVSLMQFSMTGEVMMTQCKGLFAIFRHVCFFFNKKCIMLLESVIHLG